MKVNFQTAKETVKNLHWKEIGIKTAKVAKGAGVGVLAMCTLAYCGVFEAKDKDEKERYQNLIKDTDINRYNKMCEEVALGKAQNNTIYWEEGYKEMTDSIRIAERSYFEGAQMVRDSLKIPKD